MAVKLLKDVKLENKKESFIGGAVLSTLPNGYLDTGEHEPNDEELFHPYVGRKFIYNDDGKTYEVTHAYDTKNGVVVKSGIGYTTITAGPDEYELIPEYSLTEDSVSNDAIIDEIPESGLKNLLKSAGVKLAGNESGDELKGMFQMLPKNERLLQRVEKLKKIYKESSMNPEDFGGYMATFYIKCSKQLGSNLNKLAAEVKVALDNANGEILSTCSDIDINSISFAEAPAYLFEGKLLKEIAVRTKDYDAKSYMHPDIPGSYVKVIEDDDAVYYHYTNMEDARNAFDNIVNTPDPGVTYVAVGVVTEGDYREVVSQEQYIDSLDESYTYNHDCLDSDLVPEIDEEKAFKDDDEEKEILIENPPLVENKKVCKSKFIKK